MTKTFYLYDRVCAKSKFYYLTCKNFSNSRFFSLGCQIQGFFLGFSLILG